MKDGQPSITALYVALAVIAMGRIGSSLLPKGDILTYQVALLQAVELPFPHRLALWLVANDAFGVWMSQFLYWLVNFLVGKNAMECLAFRKSFMEQQVRQFLHDNPTSSQVLILGAGYDTLALRLAKEYVTVNFWEIDHPATGNFKNRVWMHGHSHSRAAQQDSSSHSSPHLIKNLYHASVDLSQKDALVEVLGEQSNYRVSTPTIAILEGVTMYLTPDEMEALTDDVAQVMPSGSILCFDMLASQEGKPRLGFLTPVISAYVKLKGEPFKLGMDAGRLEQFLRQSNTWTRGQDSELQTLGPSSYAAIQLK